VLIDRSGNPCLTDFGLSTVAGDVELQLTTLTTERSLDSRWRAPEVIGIESNPERPSFKSDIYSFGGVMFFVRSAVFLQRYPELSHHRSSPELYRGNKRGHPKSSPSCRKKLPPHVLMTSWTITGT
jgi:serine/threonine protein kinase